MISRILEKHLIRLAKQYPVVTVTGPRQSGKTVLTRHTFPHKPYVNLESPEVRKQAQEDPQRFLSQFPDGAVIDEVQRVPDLLSYIQVIVDKKKQDGQFILTGSAQFELQRTISQSLAGRTALLNLLPFSIEEIKSTPFKAKSVDDYLYQGFYPRIYDKKLVPSEAYSFYMHTYVERDVRNLLNVKDLSKFEIFMRLCAARTGQLLNLSQLGNDCGINHNTAASWLSILEASYIIFRLKPHHNNFSKRLIKSPKIYFYDVGLAAYLLGIQNSGQIAFHPLRGNLFETMVVSELIKKRFNAVQDNNLYFFRDNVGNEVDIIMDYSETVLPIEIKSGQTFAENMTKGLRFYLKLNDKIYHKPCLVYGGSRTFEHKDYLVLSVNDLSSLQTNI